MVKANELRLGNIVEKDGAEYVADFITIQMAHNYNSIPLTPEILERCGFKEEGLQCDYTLGEVDLHRMDNGYAFGPYGYIMTNKIHSLHQLQNLYFALTGDELTVNL